MSTSWTDRKCFCLHVCSKDLTSRVHRSAGYCCLASAHYCRVRLLWGFEGGAETIQPGEAADGKQEAPKWSTCCLLWAVDQTLTPETPWKPSPLTKSRSWTKDKQSTPLGGNRERAGRNQTRTKLSRTDPTISLKNESKLRTTAKVCAFTNIFSLSAQ